MRVKLLILALLVAFAGINADAAKKKPARNIDNVKKEQKATEKKIKETSKKLDENAAQTKKTLNRLNSIQSDITTNTKAIGRMRSSIDSLNTHIKIASDSVVSLSHELSAIKTNYTASMRKLQGTANFMDMAWYVLSAKSFSEASSRIRFAKEFSSWSQREIRRIQRATNKLEAQKEHLGTMQSQRTSTLNNLTSTQNQLEQQKKETNQLVTKLKKESGNLKTILKQNEKRMRDLDRELDRLIAAEQRRIEEANRKKAEAEAKKNKDQGKSSDGSKPTTKPQPNQPTGIAEADRVLNGSFESNKGRLLFPVSGKYKIVRGFGRQRHPELQHVETENNGIDIEVAAGATARSIFEGKVSAIFKQPGFNTIVMIRHGSYLSVYANLASIRVKVGDSVKANQVIGNIYSDPDNEGKSTLHFELRKERAKLNPLQWVK